jgi:hypothetical protein
MMIKKKTKDIMRKNVLRSPVIMMTHPLCAEETARTQRACTTFEHSHTSLIRRQVFSIASSQTCTVKDQSANHLIVGFYPY